ncbi:uncharacterized protein LOC122254502 [Penaeus japonicus]|uniref:uncharacterized protein LOC122254502 n=1 Tax=Penaeus japonicus TaxID=27405 RepID=UPI001C70EEB8|nr:uncharacterized protein LOC122254502 [Penaeus japonicus]
MYSFEALKSARTFPRSGCPGEARMGALPGLGPRSACLRCCQLRRKQRLLAVLTASTGFSLLLLLLHTASVLPSRKGFFDGTKELPERSNYVRSDIALRESVGVRAAARQELLWPATTQDSARIPVRRRNVSKRDRRWEGSRILGLPGPYQWDGIGAAEQQERPSHAALHRGVQNGTLGGGSAEGQRKPHAGVNAFQVRPRPTGIDLPAEVKPPIKSSKNLTGSSALHSSAPSRTRKEPGGGGGGDGGVEDGALSASPSSGVLVFDYSRPAYFPWMSTKDECANFATRFLLGGRAPLIALASFPGSGNTWLRYVVEVLTGVFTGSVYHDEVLAIKGFWGERDGYRQGTTLMQKTHSFPLLPHEVKDGIYNGQEFRFLLPKSPRRTVLLLRNPWESLVALRHFHAAGHTGFGSGSYFKGEGWANFTIERADFWVKLNKAWLSLSNTDMHVIHYEHLQHDLEQEAERLVSFLGLPIDYGRVECLVRYPEGKFRRPKYPKHLQGYRFPTKTAEILRKGMGHLAHLLKKGGHPPFPTHLYTFTPIVADPPLAVGQGGR